MSNLVAYTDIDGKFNTIDAAEYLQRGVMPRYSAEPVATDLTCIKIVSNQLGEIEVARGQNIVLPTVAHVVEEINQICAAGFGGWAHIMGYQGVVYYNTNPKIAFLPSREFFPVNTCSAAFYAGDQVIFSGLNEGSVLQADSTPIAVVGSEDTVMAEVVMNLGKKAVVRVE